MSEDSNNNNNNNNNNNSNYTEQVNKEEKLLEEQVVHLNNKLIYERQLRVAEAAQRIFEEEGGQFKIRLKIPTGKMIVNAFGDEELEYKNGINNIETYHYHKLSANDNNIVTIKRAELANSQDPTVVADLTNRIYEFLALKFLGIKHDDYVRAEWDDIRLAVDVCNHINEWQNKEIEIMPEEKRVRVIKKPTTMKNYSSPKLDTTFQTLTNKTIGYSG